eukprot:CAMPEP_0171457080 /NCGR_PEP_ID=MMETSP0945-20130129/3302_1 /TAXON_ID=109269 /ORGANISM="Vaucheria litorea, Strain CCMP2940" /LENGTH=273 /DNA_ID=CAMNT_0011982617 /DNA_START=159 /DNA_END=977 /DNA_ORIENTATION=+
MALIKLKKDVLDKVLLRRTKEMRSKDIELPPRIICVKRFKLSPKEEDFYQALYTQSRAQFDDYVNAGVILNNYAHIFDILIRLRQALDHPYLVVHSKSQALSERPVIGNSHEKVECDCGLCNEVCEDPVVSECGHYFCRSCIELLPSVEMRSHSLKCPVCDQMLSIGFKNSGSKQRMMAGSEIMSALQRKSILNKIDLMKFQTSTKMEALMKELHDMQERDPSAKAIVFSQFVNMLDLLEYRIKIGRVKCVKISGHMNLKVRDAALKKFREEP